MRCRAVAGSGWGLLLLALLLQPLLLQADRIDSNEQALQQLRQRIQQLQGDLGSNEKRQQQLTEELRSSEQQIGRMSHRLRQLATRMQQQQSQLERLQQQRQSLQGELDLQRDALARQMRAAYAMGRQQRLKILLNQQDPALLSRMLVYYDYFNRARAQQLARIDRMLAQLNRNAQAIATEQQQLQQLQQQQQLEKQQLEQGRALRQQVVAALTGDIRDKGRQLKGLRENEQQLQAVLEKLQQELVALPIDSLVQVPFKSLKGRLQWPTKGRLVASFGSRKAGNLKWDGVMIAAPEGREVRAVHRGRVAYADWLRGFGLLLIVDHGDGYMTLYGNNQSLFKETGEWVETGEAIALVGSSGGRATPAAYFGIRFNGKPVNPKRWCRRIKGNRVVSRLNMAPLYWSNGHNTLYEGSKV